MSDERLPIDETIDAVLRGYSVPALAPDFADRVVAASAARTAELPRLRKTPAKHLRSGRRLAIGLVAAGALATAAAATGLLGQLGLPIPSAGEMWSRISGEDTPAPSASPAPAPSPVPEGTLIEGPLDTPEELDEAFRRIDEVREQRRDTRRDRVDQRIDEVIERRRAQGLPAPTPEEEQRLRERLEQARSRADARREQVQGERREQLRERVEAGEAITSEDIAESLRTRDPDSPLAQRIERLRQMPPEERREAIRQLREQRRGRLARQTGEPVESPEEIPAEPGER